MDGVVFDERYSVSDEGVEIAVEREHGGGLAYMLPVFCYDGEKETVIAREDGALTVSYEGWRCVYTADAPVSFTGKVGCNRNGRYRIFAAEGEGRISLKVQIVRI